MSNGLAVGLLVLLGFAGAAAAQTESRYDGQYTGELALVKVADRHDCTAPPLGAVYPLTISGGQVRFAYVPRFETTLTGTVDANGTFKAIARIRKGTVQMTGAIQGYRLSATIVSPSCRYTFQARR